MVLAMVDETLQGVPMRVLIKLKVFEWPVWFR